MNSCSFDFDRIIDRRGTGSMKYEKVGECCGADDIMPMWVADMDFATPPFVMRALERCMSHRILGYTCGCDPYYESIVNWCRGHYGWNISKEQINYIPGVVSGIFLAVQCLTEKSDRILIQDPVYHPFHIVPETTDRLVVRNSLVRTDDGFDVDIDALRRDLEGCKLMILCNPHNPVGICWSRDILVKVAEICYELGVIVVSDEIHCDMVLGGRKHIPFASVSEKAREIAITLQSPSKSFNMPGVVCAQMIIQNDVLREKMFNYVHGSDMDMGNAFAFECASACYTPEGDEWRNAMLEYISGNVQALKEELQPVSDKIKVIEPKASFLVFLDCRALGYAEGCAYQRFFAEKCRIGVNPGDMFGPGGLGYMRINIACPRSQVREAANRIVAAVRSLND